MKKKMDVAGKRGSSHSVNSVHSVVKKSSNHRVHGIHGMKKSFGFLNPRVGAD
jgi:hypothetical protein